MAIKHTLPEYVEQNKIGLIAKSMLGAKTASLVNLQTGIKTNATINLLNTDVKFQNGAECNFNASGDVNISQRTIETVPLKVNMTFCDKSLLKTALQHDIKMNANKTSLPFEEEFTNSIVASVKSKIETMMWQGEKSDTSFDGYLKFVEATQFGATAYEMVKKAITNLPINAIKEDTKVFMGKDLFMTFVQEMVDKNLYHYSADNNDFTMIFPGTTIEIIAVDGLNGTDKVVATRLSNMYYGCDMEDDAEVFDLYFDKSDRIWKLVIEFNGGVNFAFTDEVVVVGKQQ